MSECVCICMWENVCSGCSVSPRKVEPAVTLESIQSTRPLHLVNAWEPGNLSQWFKLAQFASIRAKRRTLIFSISSLLLLLCLSFSFIYINLYLFWTEMLMSLLLPCYAWFCRGDWMGKPDLTKARKFALGVTSIYADSVTTWKFIKS